MYTITNVQAGTIEKSSRGQFTIETPKTMECHNEQILSGNERSGTAI